jgi:NAD(P)-dependent dehydrogenase (short-subunit alcohol dehydrogenase family)
VSTTTGMLANRAALVVGLDDIGTGIARRFACEGARLAVLDPEDPVRTRTLEAELDSAWNSTRGEPPSAANAPLHQAIVDEIGRAIRTLGRLDVLVCNLLPPSQPCPLERLDDTGLDAAFARVRGTLVAMRTALPALRESGRGRIVLVGHRYGDSVSEAIGAYNAAALGLLGLARSAAVEWGQYQITTNVLLPLARTAEFDAARARRPAVVDLLVSQLPLRRVGDAEEDVGGAAAFLASDAACFVNGEVLCADGGQQVAGPVLNPARFT